MSGVAKKNVIKVSNMKFSHMKQHLDLITEHARIAADYGAHGEGQSSRGGFSGSGMSGGAASNAEYSTTNTGNTADSDSQGSSEY